MFFSIKVCKPNSDKERATGRNGVRDDRGKTKRRGDCRKRWEMADSRKRLRRSDRCR